MLVPEQRTFFRRLCPLALSQFTGYLVEYAYKTLIILMLCKGFNNAFQASLMFFFVLVLFALPTLVFAPLAGFVSDRMPKRYISLATKIVELILLLVATSCFKDPAVSKTCLFTFLILGGIQNAFFEPSVIGLLPEVFREKELSDANGKFSACTLFGAILGFVLVPLFQFQYNCPPHVIMRILAVVSFLGFVSSYYITQTISVVQMHRESAYSFRECFSKGWHVVRQSHLLIAATGDALFSALVGVVLLLLGFYVYSPSFPAQFTTTDITILRLSPIIGMMVGYYVAGMISNRKIELGLIPFGAAGATIFLVLGIQFPGADSEFSFNIPGVCSATLHLFWPAMIFLALAGMCGGLFSVPIRSFFLQRSNPEARGAAVALARGLAYVIAILTNCILLCLVAGMVKESPDLPEYLSFLKSFPAVSPNLLIILVAIVILVVTVVAMWMLPDFALRFLIITLGNIFYRIRAKGVENIPERGPALLLANHASYIDAILISTCTSRRVRFLMQESVFERPLLKWFAKLTGFIKVPERGPKSIMQMLELVRDSLKKGNLVCVFPEGTPSHNGILGKFSSGYEHMIPKDVEVPIIPVNIGRIWGSLFSYFRGPIHFRLPKEFPYFAVLTVGKPLPKDVTPFEVRQKITELCAESAMELAPHEHPVHYILGKNAKLHPFQPIIRDAADGKTLNFFKTYLGAILISREIRRLNPSDSKYVGVLLPNGTAAVVSIMGVLLADKVPCPLNFSTSQEILEASIKKAKIKLVLTNRLFLAKVRLKATEEMVYLEDIAKTIPLWKKILTMIGIFVLPYKELLNMIAPLSHNDNYGEAALLFSSGSTGKPKGVRLSHHNMYSDAFAMLQSVAFNPKKDGIFGNLPMFHSFGISTGLWLPIITRCRPMTYVHSPLDANLIGESIVKYKINVLVATPSFLLQYLRKFKPEVFETLRIVISGAEKLRSDISEKFYKAVNGRLEILEGYGCTELSPVVSINVCPDIMDTGIKSGKKGSIGLALETVCARIMDPLTFKPVPPESEGLLFIKGPMVMQGYLDDPEQNAKVLIDGYYNTGDIAKMDETGYITICGRLSRFSKIAGEMVPHEMVECIINEMCGLESRVVAVASIPDQQKGEALLVLYTDEMPMTPDKIVSELRERSISNLWIPKATNFVRVDSLPILGSGKLDLTVLRKIADEVAQQRQAEEKK